MLQIILLLLINQGDIQVNGPYAAHTSLEFGFKKNGHYFINISNPSSGMAFGLATETELDHNIILKYDSIPRTDFCKGKYQLANIQAVVEKGEFAVLEGDIPSKGVYTPIYYGCEEHFSFHIAIDFLNGKDHLDYRTYPSIIYTPIFLGLFGLMFILWLVNWFTHFTLEIKIHYFLTTCFTLSVILSGLYYGYLRDLKNIGFLSDAIYYSYYIFDSVYTLFLLITLLLASKGWYIITKHIEFKKIIPSIICSLGYVILNTLLIFLSLGLFDFLIAFAALICLGVYIAFITRNVNEGLLKITAHILAIKNSGIDPKTTPVYSKYKMFKLYFKALIVFAILIFVDLIVEVFAGDLLWLPRLISNITTFVLNCFLFYIFMIRQKRYNGYLMFEEGEGGDVDEISQNDIQNFQAEGIEAVEGGNEWDENTPLPPQPKIIGYDDVPANRNTNGTNNEYSLENLDSNQNVKTPNSAYENPIKTDQA